MKSRTLISLVQRPGRNPTQGETGPPGTVANVWVATMSVLLCFRFSGSCFDEPQHMAGMAGDHQLFVRRDDPHRHAAACGRDAPGAAAVGVGIQPRPEPGGRLANAAPDLGSVL